MSDPQFDKKEMTRMALNSQNVFNTSSVNVRRLHPGDILFSHLSYEKEHLVCFCMEPVFNVRELLGASFSREDFVNATAYYDMAHRASLRTLDIIIHADADQEYQYRYLLTGEERRMLSEKMATYYLKTTGIQLEQLCQDFSARRVLSPKPQI